MELISNEIDRGEREAIAIAQRLAADYVLMDERAGRKIATSLGLRVIGTLGLLGRADELGLIANLSDTIQRPVEHTNFRADPETVARLLGRKAKHKP